MAGIVGVCLLAYANSFPGAFFFDDESAILRNTSLRNLSAWKVVLSPPQQAGIGGRPLANLAFALNYAVGGYAPVGYHVVNLAIHVATALLLFALVRRTVSQPQVRDRLGGGGTTVAFLAAAFWAVHPIQTNVVDYISQRTESLMAFCYLVTLYAFLRSTDSERPPTPGTMASGEAVTCGRSKAWAGLAVVAAMCGMATKETMVTVPVAVLLYDRTFLAGSFGGALKRHGGRVGLIAASWLLLAWLITSSHPAERGVGFDLPVSPLAYALTECRALVHYVQLSFWPHPLIFDYGADIYVRALGEAWPWVAVVAGMLALTGWALWRAPLVGFAAAWFFLILSPSSSVVPIIQQPCAENRLYLPLAAVAAALAVGAYRTLGRAAVSAFALGIVALGVLTGERNTAFRDELTLWRDTVARHPANARAHNNLGGALLKAGQTDAARAQFRAALALSPHYADAHNNAGVALLQENRTDEAIGEFQRAIAMRTDYADAYYNLGEAYLRRNDNAPAITAFATVLRLDPRSAKAANNLGIALLNVGRTTEAIVAERAALAIEPKLPEANYNLGNALAAVGKIDDALEAYATALRLDPGFAKAYNNRGVLLLRLNRWAEARAAFEAALRANPTYTEARRHLELVRERAPSQH